MTVEDLLSRTVGLLVRAGVPYMLTGSVASTWYGEPRATLDLDIVINPDADALERLVGLLDAEGFYVDPDAARAAFSDRSQFNAVGDDATKVDFIIRKDRPFSMSEFERRRSVDLLGTECSIVSVEDLIVAKLEWAANTGSERQLRDVQGILEVAGDGINRAYLAEWVPRLGLGDLWRQATGDAAEP